MTFEYQENPAVRRRLDTFRSDLLDFIAANRDLAPETITSDLAALKRNPDLATQRWALETVLKLMSAYPSSKMDVGVSGDLRMERVPDYSGLGLTRQQLAAIAGVVLDEETGAGSSVE